MLHRMMSAPLEDIQKPRNVIFNIGVGIGQRIPDPGLSGQIYHHIEFFSRKESGDGISPSDVHLEEFKILPCLNLF